MADESINFVEIYKELFSMNINDEAYGTRAMK